MKLQFTEYVPVKKEEEVFIKVHHGNQIAFYDFDSEIPAIKEGTPIDLTITQLSNVKGKCVRIEEDAPECFVGYSVCFTDNCGEPLKVKHDGLDKYLFHANYAPVDNDFFTGLEYDDFAVATKLFTLKFQDYVDAHFAS